MFTTIPSATLKQLVALSQRKESLMAQIQEIDRQMMRVQRKFIVPSQNAATQAPVTVSRSRTSRGKRAKRGPLKGRRRK